ncbi:MAG: LPS export ABC transporter periplasmic protein LptC [Spirochaetales bacterium]|nr:LPS export ABC transporter periplasmic protein LptC [Spirochaetales bacterium]
MRVRCFFLSMLLFLGACRLDYQQAMVADELSEGIPETILIDFTHSIIKNGIPMMVFSAVKAETYEESNKTTLEQVAFRQFNSLGEPVSEGKADHAVLYSSTEDMELWGNIYFYSIGEESSIEADYLYWNDEEGTLTAREKDVVTIQRDSGTSIQGTGFQGHLYEKDILFRGKASGAWVEDEEE